MVRIDLLRFFALLLGFFYLLRMKTLNPLRYENKQNPFVSVIIPARNEEKNIKELLSTLQKQTYKNMEVIVVDDDSNDRTYQIAKALGARVIKSAPEEGWMGKNMACYKGFLASKGDILIFIDADVRLGKRAVETLVSKISKTGGIVSVMPFMLVKHWYERISLLYYLVGCFSLLAFKKTEGMFGACYAISRKDYVTIGGHESIKGEILDDISLAKRAASLGLRVSNFYSRKMISAYFYPGGFKEMVRGWTRNFPLGAKTISFASFLLVFIWVSGAIGSGIKPLIALFFPGSSDFSAVDLFYYASFAAQIIIASRRIGDFGFFFPMLYFIPSIFFAFSFIISVIRLLFAPSINWKNRKIKIAGKRE